MKKLICIIITIATLFLVSCGGTTPIEEPTETPAPGARYRGVVEGKSRILLFHGGTLWYYSKVDGESYNFCFDPLCRHSLKNDFCISRLFSNHLYMTEGCVYSEKYDRFYFTRGQNIYSTSFDASDLKLEYSFGENGKIDRSLKSADLIEYNTNLSCLRIHGDYLFFIRANDDTGTWQIVRYNIVTKKAEEMTASEGEWITSYEIADDYIYFKTLKDNMIKLFTTDFDFKELKEVDDSLNITATNAHVEVYYDGYFYGRKVNIVDGAETDGELYRINPLTNEKKLIAKDDRLGNGSSTILCADKNGLYFSTWNYVATGIVTDSIMGPHEVGTANNNIWRVSYDGEFTKVLDFPRGEIDTINIVDGGAVIHFGRIYHKQINIDEPEAVAFVYVMFEIDENGNFVNPKPIGNNAANEELIEFFEGYQNGETPSTPTETTAATTATTATTAGEPITVGQFVPTGYQKYSILSAKKDIETPSGVILISVEDDDTADTWYYDKKSGEIRVLCSDPDCDHVFFNDTVTWTYDLDCPAAMMGNFLDFFASFSFAPVYVNGRVYFTCLSGMYSCTENGGDVREEFKFSENTNYVKERQKYLDGKFPFIRIFSDGRSIFFYHYENKNGFLQYRYDTWTRELYDMTDDLEKAASALGYTVYVDSAVDGKIYLARVKELLKDEHCAEQLY